LTTSVSILATEAIKCHVDSNRPQASDLIPLIRRRNCLRGALNRTLFKSISRSLVSDVRFATGIAVTPAPAVAIAFAVTKGGSHFSTCIRPVGLSRYAFYILARETRATVSITQHAVSVLTHGSEPVLTALNLRSSRLEAMQV